MKKGYKKEKGQMTLTRKTATKGIELIKNFEGLRLTAYRCAAGVWTIGYGHTGTVDGKLISGGMTITAANATELLRKDLSYFEASVNACVTAPITQNMFDALVSFAFNVGAGALRRSTLLKKLNAQDYDGAADEFLLWNKAGGKVLEGLVRRRKAERALFLNGASAIVVPAAEGFSKWDDELLATELASINIPDLELSDFGFDFSMKEFETPQPAAPAPYAPPFPAYAANENGVERTPAADVPTYPAAYTPPTQPVEDFITEKDVARTYAKSEAEYGSVTCPKCGQVVLYKK